LLFKIIVRQLEHL